MTIETCANCGKALVPAATGRPARFCSARCRVAASRAGQARDAAYRDPEFRNSHRGAWAGSERAEQNVRLINQIWGDGRPHRCGWCGGDLRQAEASAHHLIPRGWQGSTDWSTNLELVHTRACHDEIELWTEDHGRPPSPIELGGHRRTGVIREPVVRHIPRLADIFEGSAAPLEEALARNARLIIGGKLVELTWSPVAPVIAERLRAAGYLVEIREPYIPGDTPEAFYARHGLTGVAWDLEASSPTPRSAQELGAPERSEAPEREPGLALDAGGRESPLAVIPPAPHRTSARVPGSGGPSSDPPPLRAPDGDSSAARPELGRRSHPAADPGQRGTVQLPLLGG